MKKPILLLFVMLFALILLSSYIVAEDGEFESGGEDGEGGEGAGSLAIGLLWLGAIYVIGKRLYVYSKKLQGKESNELLVSYQNMFKSIRKPLLVFHNVVMILATIAAGIHGWALTGEGGFTVIAGWIAFTAMFLSSVSGIIIYKRVWPFWENRSSRKVVSFLHRQWLFTGILLFFLFLHLIGGD